MKEKTLYIPLDLDIVEFQMEKGYAQSSDGLGDIGNGGSVWD